MIVMTVRQQKLVEDNKYMIYSIADKMMHRVCARKIDRRDVIQEGYLGLCQAAINYDETRGNRFSTYAYAYILGRIQTLISHDSTIKPKREGTKYVSIPTVSINVLTCECQDNHGNKKLSYEERLADDKSDYVLDELDYSNAIKRMMTHLDETQQTIVQYLYDGYKQNEIAHLMNVAPAQISRQIKLIASMFNKDDILR